jgi:hypothetical protein
LRRIRATHPIPQDKGFRSRQIFDLARSSTGDLALAGGTESNDAVPIQNIR